MFRKRNTGAKRTKPRPGEWCEKKLSFERKRRRRSRICRGEDWLDGKISPVAEPWLPDKEG